MFGIAINLTTDNICNKVCAVKYFAIQLDDLRPQKKTFEPIFLRYIFGFEINYLCI